MNKRFVEENGVYQIDCSKSIWATDEMNETYHNAGVQLKDSDFLIENASSLFVVEYKNANVTNAANPDAFKPEGDKMINKVVQKFYDSLHYLYLRDNQKPVQYIYILEYPKGDIITRKRLRNKMKQRLPFALQENMGTNRKLIQKVDVVSIEEWNSNEEYGEYPITKLSN